MWPRTNSGEWSWEMEPSVLCQEYYRAVENGDGMQFWYKMHDLGIKTSTEYPYTIFHYGVNVDFSNPIVQEARGIIIDFSDRHNLRVACWPFRKFGNYQESYADEIDWSTARVQEKIDGSIVKLWHDPHQNRWRWSTNSIIDAGKALTGHDTVAFLNLIELADNYDDVSALIKADGLDPTCTYMFELVGPYNQVVVKYETTHLYHIGTRSNIAGQEFGHTINMDHPKSYSLGSLDECIAAVAKLNKGADGIAHEGFVVVDADYHRIKVKSPEYLLMHHVVANHTFPMKNIVSGLRSGLLNADEMCRAYPALEHLFRYYQWQIAEFEYQAEEMCRTVDRLGEEFGGERKAIAMSIKDNRYQTIGFKHMDNGQSAQEIIEALDNGKYLKYITPYESNTNQR